MFFNFHLICETKVTKPTLWQHFTGNSKVFPLLVDNLKSEDYFYAQKKEHEKENSIKIAFYCKLFGGCVQPVLQ